MRIRYAAIVLGVICASGCQGNVLDVGSPEDGGNGGSSTGSSSGNSGSSGATGISTIVTPTQVTCPADASTSLGEGYSVLLPTECSTAPGVALAVTSASDVAGALVGEWRSCANADILGEGALGIQFTADGRYQELTSTDDFGLVAIGSAQASALGGHFGADAGEPAYTGAFSVVDGSDTYGPGTYTLHLNPDNGGLFEGEVTVSDSPHAFDFQAINGNAIVFVPAAPLSPRANICSSCTTPPPPGTAIDEDDPTALAADVVGRWVWCSGLPPPQQGSGLGMGIEFVAGGAWYELDEAANGTLSRSTDPRGSGTLSFVPSSEFPSVAGASGPYDYILASGPGVMDLGQLVVTQDPKGLWLTTGGGGCNNGVCTVYSYMSPLP